MRRAATWTVAGVVILAGAFVTGDVLDPFDAERNATRAPAGSPTTSPSVEPTEIPSPESSPDPDDPFAYFTTDGSDPALSPACSGAMGLCLGGPIERATEAFGIEDERFEGQEPGSILRAWNMDDIRLTVEADDVGSITTLSVSIPGDRETSVRVALPEGLVLGALTLGDVVDRLGPPQERDDFVAENVYFYIYAYPYGPEATHRLTFGHSSEGQAVDAGALPERLVTTFTAEYAS